VNRESKTQIQERELSTVNGKGKAGAWGRLYRRLRSRWVSQPSRRGQGKHTCRGFSPALCGRTVAGGETNGFRWVAFRESSPEGQFLSKTCGSKQDSRRWAYGAERPPTGGFRFAPLRMTSLCPFRLLLTVYRW